MKTVIMAGGKGTRISQLFPDIPKPLIPFKNSNGIEKPVLEWELIGLRNKGFKDILITVSYKAQQIKDYFGDGSRLEMNIDYYVEDKPLGNAGALFKIRHWLGNEPFLLLNADSVFDVDFNRMVEKHKETGASVTLFTHPNSHPYDSGLIISDEKGRVVNWLSKEDERPKWYKNRVNAGIHIIDPTIIDESGIDEKIIGTEIDGRIFKVDLDRMILKPLCGKGKMFCYDSPEYVKDMGTPERYKIVRRDFEKGIVESRNLLHNQKAVFLDRDGTINKYVGFLRTEDELELIEGAADAIKRINESEYLCIVITNQPVIARGEVTSSQLETIHNKLETLLGENGSYIDALYYCPHHPDKGFVGEIKELKIECDCRKPKPGMILKASRDYNIDLSQSWMIGDGLNDIKAGLAAGCRTILLSDDSSITSDEEKNNKNNENSFVLSRSDITENLLKAIELIGL